MVWLTCSADKYIFRNLLSALGATDELFAFKVHTPDVLPNKNKPSLPIDSEGHRNCIDTQLFLVFSLVASFFSTNFRAGGQTRQDRCLLSTHCFKRCRRNPKGLQDGGCDLCGLDRSLDLSRLQR
jgi:hypothetical protein